MTRNELTRASSPALSMEKLWMVDSRKEKEKSGWERGREQKEDKEEGKKRKSTGRNKGGERNGRSSWKDVLRGECKELRRSYAVRRARMIEQQRVIKLFLSGQRSF